MFLSRMFQAVVASLLLATSAFSQSIITQSGPRLHGVTFGGGGGGDGNDGFIVTNGSTYEPLTAQIQSLDVNSNLPVAVSTAQGAQVTFANETWWSGTTGVATFYPPTEGNWYSGFGEFDFWNNATNVVRQVNVRWEFLISTEHLFGDLSEPPSGVGLPKWLIIDTKRELSTDEEVLTDRPMLFLAHMNEADSIGNRIENALTFVPAQDTVRAFQTTNNIPAPTFGSGTSTGYQNSPYTCIRATSGTTSTGNPIIANTEYLVVEARVNVMGTTDEPNGVIAMRVYRRDGTYFERATAWTNTPNDTGERPLIDTNYISRVDVGGGGYYNDPNPHSAGLWIKVGRRVTLATNYQPTTGRAWLGPPEGFVE